MKVHYSIDKDMIDSLWEKVKDSKNVYRLLDASSKDDFMDVMLNSDLIIEFPFGIIRITGLGRYNIYVHGIFWSKEAFRQALTIEKAIHRVGVAFGASRAFCAFPKESKAIRHLLEMGSFKFYEYGNKMLSNGEAVRTYIYMLQLDRVGG